MFEAAGECVNWGLHTGDISPSRHFFISAGAAKNQLKIKKAIVYWKPQDTTSCLRFALSLFSSLPQRIPSTRHHSSLSQNHLTSSIIPIVWSFYCSYRSFISYSRSQLYVQTQICLRFFLIPSCSFPEAPQDTFKGWHSLYCLNPYLESPCLPASSYGENKNISLRCWDSVFLADKAQLTPQIIFLMMSRHSTTCPQEWEYFLHDQNTPADSELNTGNKPISTFKLSTRLRLQQILSYSAFFDPKYPLATNLEGSTQIKFPMIHLFKLLLAMCYRVTLQSMNSFSCQWQLSDKLPSQPQHPPMHLIFPFAFMFNKMSHRHK